MPHVLRQMMIKFTNAHTYSNTNRCSHAHPYTRAHAHKHMHMAGPAPGASLLTLYDTTLLPCVFMSPEGGVYPAGWTDRSAATVAAVCGLPQCLVTAVAPAAPGQSGGGDGKTVGGATSDAARGAEALGTEGRRRLFLAAALVGARGAGMVGLGKKAVPLWEAVLRQSLKAAVKDVQDTVATIDAAQELDRL